jgi:hypothetical protein
LYTQSACPHDAKQTKSAVLCPDNRNVNSTASSVTHCTVQLLTQGMEASVAAKASGLLRQTRMRVTLAQDSLQHPYPVEQSDSFKAAERNEQKPKGRPHAAPRHQKHVAAIALMRGVQKKLRRREPSMRAARREQEGGSPVTCSQHAPRRAQTAREISLDGNRWRKVSTTSLAKRNIEKACSVREWEKIYSSRLAITCGTGKFGSRV